MIVVYISLGAFGEILPYHDNKMLLDYNKTDKWGLPTISFDAKIRENELNMRKDMKDQAVEMLEKAGFKNVKGHDNKYAMGHGIHEMGTARMGKNPERSVVNEWGRCHDVKNMFIVDGSIFVTSSALNPTCTIQALSLYITDQIKKNIYNLFD